MIILEYIRFVCGEVFRYDVGLFEYRGDKYGLVSIYCIEERGSFMIENSSFNII